MGERRGYRSGYYDRKLTLKVGEIEIRVPQDRAGLFKTSIFERYQRSEKALVSKLAEMYVKGVSTRKVTKLAERLCGRSFSPASISNMVRELDESLQAFAKRSLAGQRFPYVILDARYEKIREEGSVRNQAILIALGIDETGRRHVLAVETASEESHSSWKQLLMGLKERGLTGVEYVVSDSHEGLKQAICEVYTTALWQRCVVHFMRNTMSYVKRGADPACLDELKLIWASRDAASARQALNVWVAEWGDHKDFRKLVDWVEENFEETFSMFRLPRAHRKRMKSTNMLERLNQEIKRRTKVVRIFPNQASCLRLIRALLAETHDEWVTGYRYLEGTP